MSTAQWKCEQHVHHARSMMSYNGSRQHNLTQSQCKPQLKENACFQRKQPVSGALGEGSVTSACYVRAAHFWWRVQWGYDWHQAYATVSVHYNRVALRGEPISTPAISMYGGIVVIPPPTSPTRNISTINSSSGMVGEYGWFNRLLIRTRRRDMTGLLLGRIQGWMQWRVHIAQDGWWPRCRWCMLNTLTTHPLPVPPLA